MMYTFLYHSQTTCARTVLQPTVLMIMSFIDVFHHVNHAHLCYSPCLLSKYQFYAPRFPRPFEWIRSVPKLSHCQSLGFLCRRHMRDNFQRVYGLREGAWGHLRTTRSTCRTVCLVVREGKPC